MKRQENARTVFQEFERFATLHREGDFGSGFEGAPSSGE
jgi:hypothetical protein